MLCLAVVCLSLCACLFDPKCRGNFFFYSLCRFVSWQILSDIVLISAVPLRSAWFHTNLFSRNLLAAQGTGV